MADTLTQQIKTFALSLGFSSVGVASARPLPVHQRGLQSFLQRGRQGTMGYLGRDPERRADPARLLPGARSVIALAAVYYQGDHGPPPVERAGKVARYAWGRDYHQVVEPRLERLKAFILARAPAASIRCAVDHAPVLERAYAQEAGVGFIGKHTLLITPRHGSWVVLAELVTDLDLDSDQPATTQCGSCTRCLDACPTGAIVAPFQLDAARCIAYLTIEHKGDTPDELRPRVGQWLFGCDVCQEVCPYNRDTESAPLMPELDRARGVGPWMALSHAAAPRSRRTFDRAFAGTPVCRAGRRGLARNAAVVGGNRSNRDSPSEPSGSS